MGGEIQITDDLTLTAHWTANTYTVQYRGQSSLHTLLPDVTYSTQLCTYDVPFTMPGRPQSISLNPRKTKRRHQACENEKSSVHNLKSVMNTRYDTIIDMNGNYIAGWKLSLEQINCLLTNGNVQ